jgi:hypothetical protein
MTSFWDIAPCSLIEFDRHFRGASLTMEAVTPLKYKSTSMRLDGAISQKDVIFTTVLLHLVTKQ